MPFNGLRLPLGFPDSLVLLPMRTSIAGSCGFSAWRALGDETHGERAADGARWKLLKSLSAAGIAEQDGRAHHARLVKEESHWGTSPPLRLVVRPSGRSTTLVVTMRASASIILWARFASRKSGSQRPSHKWFARAYLHNNGFEGLNAL